MTAPHALSVIRLVNGSAGDPCLYLDYPGKHNALLFDAGDLGGLSVKELVDLEAVFLSHHHMDHTLGFDRVLRANLDGDKSLHVYGPVGTIQRIAHRLASYDIQFFPFQKLVLVVHELAKARMKSAAFPAAARFQMEELGERTVRKNVVHENADLYVEAVEVKHTAPCLAYAMVEKKGYQPDARKLAEGTLRPGPWINQVLQMLRAGSKEDATLDIQGGSFPLRVLRDSYFSMSGGARVAFVTDTLWNDEVRPRLVKLAHRATRLYCDAFYSIAEIKQARTYQHMTATHAAEFAAAAKVDQLILMHFGSRYCGRYDQLVEEARAIFPNTTAED